MRPFAQVNYLAYLDVISCSFGAAVLLFLIAVSAESQSGNREVTLLIRCIHHDGSRAEVGVEFRRPDATDWERSGLLQPGVFGFSATSEPDSGTEAFLLVAEPVPGIWEFRPYLVDFPRNAVDSKPTVVELILFSDQAWVVEGEGRAELKGDPGHTVGKSLRIRVPEELSKVVSQQQNH